MIFLLAIVFTSSLAQAQQMGNPAEGMVCIDIIGKLDANSRRGTKILVAQCCSGLKLYATLKIQNGKTIASSWRAEDQAGKYLSTERPTQRTRTISAEGRMKERITETLVIVRPKKLCFVIAQRREIIR